MKKVAYYVDEYGTVWTKSPGAEGSEIVGELLWKSGLAEESGPLDIVGTLNISLPEALRTVFDVAVESLDFGSGWLDDEEVVALRSVAEFLGVNPCEATPYNFRSKYNC